MNCGMLFIRRLVSITNCIVVVSITRFLIRRRDLKSSGGGIESWVATFPVTLRGKMVIVF